MSELKRCPFCGGEAEILEHDNGWAIWNCVMCKSCRVGQYWNKAYTKEEAVKAWNNRKPMERILERLDKKVNFVDGKITQKINLGHQVEYDQQFMNGVMYAATIVKEEEGGIE